MSSLCTGWGSPLGHACTTENLALQRGVPSGGAMYSTCPALRMLIKSLSLVLIFPRKFVLNPCFVHALGLLLGGPIEMYRAARVTGSLPLPPGVARCAKRDKDPSSVSSTNVQPGNEDKKLSSHMSNCIAKPCWY